MPVERGNCDGGSSDALTTCSTRKEPMHIIHLPFYNVEQHTWLFRPRTCYHVLHHPRNPDDTRRILGRHLSHTHLRTTIVPQFTMALACTSVTHSNGIHLTRSLHVIPPSTPIDLFIRSRCPSRHGYGRPSLSQSPQYQSPALTPPTSPCQ